MEKKVKTLYLKKMGLNLALTLSILLFSPFSSASQWVNPKKLIGDPMIARLQQVRKELYDYEKEDIKKYGYTGLELMTYMDDNRDQGMDNEAFFRAIQVNKIGHIRVYMGLYKTKYYYKGHKDLLTYHAIKPGDAEYKISGIFMEPPNLRKLRFFNFLFVVSKKFTMRMDQYDRLPMLRKIRHPVAEAKRDNWLFGSVYSFDDMFYREPWEEDHKILGKDTISGKPCFVIESKSYDPNYYLSKRVSWVEANNFLDLHEEQFDKKGRLWKVFDKDWQQVKPWNYWALTQWNTIDLLGKNRTIYQRFEWIFDQKVGDGDFSMSKLEEEQFWRLPKNPPSPIKGVSDLPPAPQVKREFWQKIGEK